MGGVARFYGLVFNDNGTLRMDCAQIDDGVAEWVRGCIKSVAWVWGEDMMGVAVPRGPCSRFAIRQSVFEA